MEINDVKGPANQQLAVGLDGDGADRIISAATRIKTQVERAMVGEAGDAAAINAIKIDEIAADENGPVIKLRDDVGDIEPGCHCPHS